MKKLLALLLSIAMVFGLAACGGETNTDGDSGSDAGTEEKATRVALIIPYIGDQSYFDVTNNGLTLLEETYGDKIETQLIEMGPDAANWVPANLQAANEGYDIIISGNFQYEAAMLEVAAQFPEIKYLNFDYSDVAANSVDNVYGVTYASNEIGYLCGVVAGVKTQSGVIGAIGGMEVPGIKQFLAGFMQGALDANPDAKVITSFVGDFSDTLKAKELANGLVKEGADILWHAAGGAGNGVFESAAENDVWAIGVDTDQYQVFKDNKPEIAEHILTSGLKRCDVAVHDSVKKIIEGTAPFGTQEVLDYSNNGVGLAENEFYLANMSEEELARVNELTEKVRTHETKVVDELVTPGVYEEYVAKCKK